MNTVVVVHKRIHHVSEMTEATQGAIQTYLRFLSREQKPVGKCSNLIPEER